MQLKKIVINCFLLTQLAIVGIVDADQLRLRMESPQYRNALYSTMPAPKSIIIGANIDSSTAISESLISVVLKRSGDTIKSWEISPREKYQKLVLDVSDISFENTRSGPYVKDDVPYKFEVRYSYNGTTAASATIELHKFPPAPIDTHEVRMDDMGRLVIDGKPTFIYGAYTKEYSDESLATLASFGLDGFIGWASNSHLDNSDFDWVFIRTDNKELDIDFSRERFKKFRSKKKLLGYRIVDEPNDFDKDPQKIREIYRVAREEDPYHPAGIVANFGHTVNERILSGKDYRIYTQSQDWIWIDSYPIRIDSKSGRDIRDITDNYEAWQNKEEKYSKWEDQLTPIGAVPQIFEQSNSWRMPHKSEISNQIYQHIANGANALFPYTYSPAYHEQWEYYGTVVGQLKSLNGALTGVRDLSGVTISYSGVEQSLGRLVWGRMVGEGKEYIFLVNTTSDWNGSSRLKRKTLGVSITFHLDGSETVLAPIRDSGMPQEFVLEGDSINIDLSGVGSESSGVVVLERELASPSAGKASPPAAPADIYAEPSQ